MQFNYVKTASSDYMPSFSQNSNRPVPDNGIGIFDNPADIERPIISAKELGTTVVEVPGQQDLIKAATSAIRFGATGIELATGQGGPTQPVGVESYGTEAREALRELGRANEVNFTSIHTPTQVGNLSGFNPQQGFIDEQRKQGVDEVKKAIKFAADVAGGGAVVVHTGEYNRPISEAPWAKETMSNGEERYKFLAYSEEPGRSLTYIVDKRTGRVVQDIRKSSIIREPVFKTAADLRKDGKTITGRRPSGAPVQDNDWVTVDGAYIDPSDNDQLFLRVPKWDKERTSFETQPLAWEDVEKRTLWYNSQVPKDKQLSPEEIAFRINITNNILQAKGSSLFYGRFYDDAVQARNKVKEALIYYEKLEKEIGEKDAWKLFREESSRHLGRSDLIAPEFKKPTEILKNMLFQQDNEMRHIHEASSAADARAAELQDQLTHSQRVQDYALQQTFKSYAEAGIAAMEETQKNPHIKKDVFVAPENIFPEQYGSHPDELIHIVKEGRKKMVEFLTSPTISDPHARIDKNGDIKRVENPYYRKGLSPAEAEKFADRHIKATFDTEHLALFWKNFTPRPGESKEETDQRFIKWHADMSKKVADSGIVGHVHLVDSMDGGHTHLPAGQGRLPLVNIVKYLKQVNPDATIVSEGHSENRRFGVDRQLTAAWRAFGTNIRGSDSPFMQQGGFGAPGRWEDVQYGYFREMQSPYFIFGPYAPSNDWTLWSQVPLE